MDSMVAENIRLQLEEFKSQYIDKPHYLSDIKYIPLNIDNSPVKLDFIYASQDIMAFRWLVELVNKEKISEFLDVGSNLRSMLFFAQICKCYYIECRSFALPQYFNLHFTHSEAQNLPFDSKRFKLATSLHALEHFGLGRYGDTIDFYGDIRGLKELNRVLDIDGHLFLSVPISTKDIPRIEFNNQRVYTKNIVDNMLNDCGFKVIEWIAPSSPFVYNEMLHFYFKDEEQISSTKEDQCIAYMTHCIKYE
jgi:SAM-dependent methyltransferase